MGQPESIFLCHLKDNEEAYLYPNLRGGWFFQADCILGSESPLELRQYRTIAGTLIHKEGYEFVYMP